ncbi:M14 family metallopeptidase [Microbulbifer agarilyticus]|uniref:M14 family metallopeptidase n=1 Tax=Microbulbifer agarilyticus TaxID=260552 RepID=UPI001CD5F115|nr:M14 metallopeptidase family protein [Microbulbifer agarilyticus]MCA0892038.1 M14 family metallopeptidase [Microbulbifer agarilyticus]
METYQKYKISGLDQPVIRQSDILPLIEGLRQEPLLTVEQVGESYQKRPLYSIALGKGATRVMLWSQMHGDEPTATPALFDLLNYITAPEQEAWRDQWMDKLSLLIIPMLNPDGAERNSRHNAQSFDINRDAKALQSPEGRVLMQLAKDFKPQFGFNLHDQGSYYGVGDSGEAATISVLAPAFNVQRDINESRGNAMQLIGVMVEKIQPAIGANIGRYDDTYAWRAFGDTFSEMGISTILIESGAHPGDPNRQVARHMNFEMLVTAIDSIASGSYLSASRATYDAIPLNKDDALVDLKIRNVRVGEGDLAYRTDLAVRKRYGQISVVDVGDLSNLTGFLDYDASGAWYQMPKAFVLDAEAPLELTDERYMALLREGVAYFEGDEVSLVKETQLPVVLNPQRLQGELPGRRRNATFLLADANGIKAAILDGELVDVRGFQNAK